MNNIPAMAELMICLPWLIFSGSPAARIMEMPPKRERRKAMPPPIKIAFVSTHLTKQSGLLGIGPKAVSISAHTPEPMIPPEPPESTSAIFQPRFMASVTSEGIKQLFLSPAGFVKQVSSEVQVLPLQGVVGEGGWRMKSAMALASFADKYLLKLQFDPLVTS